MQGQGEGLKPEVAEWQGGRGDGAAQPVVIHPPLPRARLRHAARERSQGVRLERAAPWAVRQAVGARGGRKLAGRPGDATGDAHDRLRPHPRARGAPAAGRDVGPHRSG